MPSTQVHALSLNVDVESVAPYVIGVAVGAVIAGAICFLTSTVTAQVSVCAVSL